MGGLTIGDGLWGSRLPNRNPLRRGRRTEIEDRELSRFGRAVALDGTTALVGIPSGNPQATTDTGGAAILRRVGGTWTRQTTIGPRDGSGQFGRSVGIAGSTAIVGSPLGVAASGHHGGSAAVFTRSTGSWTRAATLARGDGSAVDRFGDAVALTSTTAVVGVPTATTERGSRTGAACVFTRTDATWERQATLLPDRNDIDQFGVTVAIDDDTVVVGTRNHAQPAPHTAGLVYVFRRDGDRWHQQARLESPKADPNDAFGSTVAVDGDTATVAAPRETNTNGANAGTVHVYERRDGRWRHRQSLQPSQGGVDSQFGSTLALDDDTIIVGSRSDAWPTVFSRTGGAWTERTTLGRSGGRLSERTDTVAALDGGRALVGITAPEQEDGSITVFES